MIVHGGLVALRLAGRWAGVLIEGPSGAGKSDLALRAVDAGFRLVADDRVLLWVSGGALYGRAPDALAGLVEARGVAVLPEPAVAFARVALVVRAGAPERIPDEAVVERLGVAAPVLEMPLTDASAPAKLRRALARFDGGATRRI